MSVVEASPERPGGAELVTAAARGDRAAEGELCRRFVPAIRTFARRRLHGADAVDEFMQDVLLQLVQSLRAGAVDDPARLGGYVLGICRNFARDRAKAQERRALLWEQYGPALEQLAEGEAPARSPREVAHLEDCLSQLSERAREVIRAAYVDGEPAGTIAARLATSEGNVRVLRHRALASLRDCMQKPIFWEAA